MKKILILLLVVILIIPIIPTYSVSAYDTYTFTHYIGKCDKATFVFEYKDKNVVGHITLLSPNAVSYGRSAEEYSMGEDNITYTINRPEAGKWIIEITAVPLDNLNIIITPDDKDVDFQHGQLMITSKVDYNMRHIYDKQDTFTQAEIDNIGSKFTDINADYWGTQYIARLSYLGIISGYGDKTFRPENAIKIDEFLKMMVKTMGYDIDPDPYGYWATPYIDKAIEMKIIDRNEFEDYTLPISREQAARIIVQATGLKEVRPCINLINAIHTDIADYNAISDYYKTDVAASYAIGLFTGIDGCFKPQASLTRAQTCTIIMRYIDKSLRVPYTPESLKNVKSIVVPDLYGDNKIAYPSKYAEVIDAAYALNEARMLSTGAEGFGITLGGTGIGDDLFPTTEDRLYHFGYTDPYQPSKLANLDGGVYINLNENAEYLYKVFLYKLQSTKEKHLEVIKKMFKFWFEDDYDNALDYLSKAMDNCQNGQMGTYKVTINNRYVEFGYGSQVDIKIKARQ